MALLDGKQLRNESTSLDKLQGHSGLVTFTASATMSFSGASLTRDTADILTSTDIVNKEYVDSVAAGLDPKESVVVIATASITLSGTQSIDGYLLSVGDRVLVNGQNGTTATASNGIYVVGATAWSRASDSDGTPANEVSLGNYTFVEQGTVYGGSGWVLSVTDAGDPSAIVPGTETQQWVQFSAAGSYTAGTGLSLIGSEFSITNTTVTANSYGAAGTVPTFTVNAQGQLTAASDVSIDITASQVSDFTTAAETAIFTDANFVDGITVTFSVTAGDSVTAEVVDGSLQTGKLDSNGGATAGYVLESNGDGTFNWILPTTGDVTSIIAATGITGGGLSGDITLIVNGSNGITSTDDGVKLGGTLTENTTIDAATFDFTIGDAGTILMTASSFDVEADGFVSIDAGTGSAQYLADGTITISASNSVDIVSTGGVYVQGASFSVNSVEIDPTSASTGYVLTFDGTKFSPAAVAGTGDITEVNAGAGLTGGATQGSVTLDVELTTNGGLTFSALGVNGTLEVDESNLDYTTIASNLQGNGLTANAGVLDVNVNADSLEIVSDVLRLKDTITGDRTFTGNVVINSNLTVSGTATYVNTENLYVEDNIITLNATYSGAPLLDSGIEVNRGTGTFSKLIWDESLDYWVAGLSGSESIIIQEAGTGLTKTNNELSVDFTTVAENLQGAGLTATGGVINVGAGTGIIVNTDDVAVDFVSITGDGLTQSGGVISLSYSTIATNLDGAGLVTNGSVLDVNTGNGLSIVSDEVVLGGTMTGNITITADNGGPYEFRLDGATNGMSFSFYSNGTEPVVFDNVSQFIVNSVEIDPTSPLTGQALIYDGTKFAPATLTGDISGLTAGAGLVGGGSSGFLQLDVELTANGGLTFSAAGDNGTLEVDESNLDYTTIASNLDGAGLVANSGVLDVNLGVNSGLTFSGDTVIIDSTIAGAGLTFSGGVLSLNPTASAVPYYGDRNLTPSTTAPNTNNANSGVTITNTPNDYSRVNVYVNGQLQYLGDGVTTGDCYFSLDGTAGGVQNISDITASDILMWNGANAGFRLTTSDRIDIIYEV